MATIQGTFLNDTFNESASPEAVIVFGFQGNDSITGSASADKLYGNDAADNLQGRNGEDTIIGNSGNDFLLGDNGDDSIIGGGENDAIRGGNNNDIVDGQAGNDRLFGDAGSDIVRGGDGTDTLEGGAGNDSLFGGRGVDAITGGGDADSFYLFDKIDLFWPSPNYSDVYHTVGGALDGDTITDFQTLQNDKLVISSEVFDPITTVSGPLNIIDFATVTTVAEARTSDKPIVFVSGNSGLYYNQNLDAADFGTGGGLIVSLTGVNNLLDTDIIVEAETLPGGIVTGGDFTNDNLSGTSGNDLILGRGGNDTITGGAGNDSLEGTFGQDSITGGEGDDFLLGGLDNDTLMGGLGNDTVNGENGNDLLMGEDGNDSLLGAGGNDFNEGGLGNDTIRDGDGTDTLNGDEGDDLLIGGAQNDVLNGGVGNDTLIGDTGNDNLTGGSGSDFFLFRGTRGITPAFTQGDIGVDTITDFTSGEDKIALQRYTFSLLSVPNLATNFVSVPSNPDTQSQLVVYSVGSLYYNQNGTAPGFGDGGGEFANLTGSPSVLASDLVLIQTNF
jgi:Ca2+-binding RTX toxin-like protein